MYVEIHCKKLDKFFWNGWSAKSDTVRGEVSLPYPLFFYIVQYNVVYVCNTCLHWGSTYIKTYRLIVPVILAYIGYCRLLAKISRLLCKLPMFICEILWRIWCSSVFYMVFFHCIHEYRYLIICGTFDCKLNTSASKHA